ncbi:sulfatase family protein [Luethyella okanaganae]|uniref:Sulfatase n=1 Tax=Luethyella okanaganae TaxID=69372 RepID=A0ABW1VEG0_9MICO
MVPELREYGPAREDLRAEIIAAQALFPESTREAYELPFPADVSQTAWITDRACEFLDTAEGDVFAQISYIQPHNPFSPPAEYVDLVNIDAIPEPTSAEWKNAPIPYYEQPRYAEPSYEIADWRRERALYFADLAHLDHELGRVREALARASRLENCLFIFTSDHGELLHDHGLLGKWERHYDPCIRIPLVIGMPGVRPGHYRQLAEHTDIAATIYHWAGLPAPALPVWGAADTEGMPMLHGRSLVPVATGKDEDMARSHVFIQSNNSHVEASPRSWARTIRTTRYRYTRHLAGGGEQLFDLIEDPDEQNNLAYDERYRDIREVLLADLAEATATDAYPNSPLHLFQVGSW